MDMVRKNTKYQQSALINVISELIENNAPDLRNHGQIHSMHDNGFEFFCWIVEESFGGVYFTIPLPSKYI
jgi:hypothetical protein